MTVHRICFCLYYRDIHACLWNLYLSQFGFQMYTELLAMSPQLQVRQLVLTSIDLNDNLCFRNARLLMLMCDLVS